MNMRGEPSESPIEPSYCPRAPSLLDTLSVLLDGHTRAATVSTGLWPGLTVQRIESPKLLYCNVSDGLVLVVVVAGAGSRVAVGDHEIRGRSCYVVLDGLRSLCCRIAVASPDQPVMVMQLTLEPQLFARVITDTRGVDRRAAGAAGAAGAPPGLDDELIGTLVRFLGALWDAGDRRVLAPLHLHELVYRLVRREQFSQVVKVMSRPPVSPSMAAVVEFISANIADPLSVETLAARACLSPSAFSRAFRDLTGEPPYQFVKRVRMERASWLLGEGRLGVAEVARAVGYGSVSHFIREFRGRFGFTPGAARVGYSPGTVTSSS